VLPDTLLGLVLFVAAAGPGYVYVRVTKVRHPRDERTTLEEAAEFATFGALASAFGVVLTFLIGRQIGLLEPATLVRGPTAYVAAHPAAALVSLVLALTISYGAVWLVATRAGFDGGPTISPGESTWYAAFHRFVPRDRGVYATVSLRDGRSVAGIVSAYTIETEGVREIVLTKPIDMPIRVLTPDGREGVLADTFTILNADDIVSISGRYLPESVRAAERRPKPFWRR
jgi:Family of unknown function (DUF6338)